ncbi:RNA-binding protein 43-like isoform X1 [Mobula hypostoma]|uniref:RNA-binding protein 43-like isoform X1 n=1 Tax=Mobula hypostoma TaxID=723540 RepID=UPI002FC2FD6D
MERREATPGAGCSTWQPEMEIPCPKKIQVLNVPTIFPEQKTVNKLTMHFQKRTNGGGEVLDVKYPTSVEGCAFVMFVKEEDANNVLKHEQKLMIDKEEYTLKVCEVGSGENATDKVQVIEFVIAKLDTGRFPTGMVHNLIRKHKFEIVSYHGSVAKIKGTFSSLKELREILMKYYEYLQTVTPVTDSGQSTDSREL